MILRELINLLTFKLDKPSLDASEKSIDRVLGRLDHFGKRMMLFATTPILAFVGKATKSASDMFEIQNKFNQVFGELKDDANNFAETYSKTVGRFSGDTKKSLSSFQSMFVGLGFGNKQAFEMSTRLQKLAIDFGSFHNIADEEVGSRFIAAMSGSAEVLDQFGVNIREQAIEQQLFAMGINKSSQQATEMEKTMARLMIIEKVMGSQGAVGDAARTLDQLANKTRNFTSTLREVTNHIGNRFLPYASKLLDVGFKIVNFIQSWDDKSKRLAMSLVGILVVVGPLIVSLVSLLTVVKSLMLFNQFIGGLAGLKALALSALSPQFLLLAAAIIAAVAALALFIEDFYVWTQDGESVFGLLLGPWDRWAKALKYRFKLLTTDFKEFVKVLGDDLQNMLVHISDSLENSVFGKIMKWISLIKPAELIGGGLGTLTADLSGGDVKRRFEMYNALTAVEKPSSKKTEVKTEVNIQLPPGTTEMHQRIIEDSAKKSFGAFMSKQLRNLLDNEVE